MKRYRKYFPTIAAAALALFFAAGPVFAAITFTPEPPAAARSGVTAVAVTVESDQVTLAVTAVPGLGLTVTQVDATTVSITGVPTTAAETTIVITANDYNATAVLQTTEVRTITVYPTPVANPGQVLPEGRELQVYAPYALANFVSNVPEANQSWAYISGLPAGLGVTAGNVNGTPAAGTAGNYAVLVTVTDTRAPAATSAPVAVSLSIRAAVTVFAANGGIVYTEGTVRGADGEVTATDDLYARDLALRTVSRVTNYANQLVLNPALTPAGDKVLYTAAVDANDFRVYLVTLGTTVTMADVGVILSEAGVNYPYAALSPDYGDANPRAKTGKLAFVREISAVKSQLWVYDFSTEDNGQAGTGQRSLIQDESGLYIKHPVFVSQDVIAFVGIKNGLANIYTVSALGQNRENRTNNQASTVRYSRILSSVRSTLPATPRLIYSKQVHTGLVWGPWNVFTRTVPASGAGVETALTSTGEFNEMAPAFYGDAASTPELEDDGLMLYEASILGAVNIWQANFDTLNPGQSNSGKVQVTTVADTGQVNWGPLSLDESGDESVVFGLGDSRFFFITGSRVARADYDGAAWVTQPLNTGLLYNEMNPTLAGTGGTIMFELLGPTISNEYNIYRATPDVSVVELLIGPDAGFDAVSQPSLSQCGRFALYLNLFAAGDPAGRIYAYSPAVGAADLGLGLDDVQDPSFNPELTQVVFRRTGVVPGTEGIYIQRVAVDKEAGTIAALGSPVRMTATASGIENRQPSFSPDGRHIVFVSDRWGADSIFAIDASRGELDGRGARLVIGGDNAYPVYGPVNDDPDFYALAYVSGGEIYTASVSRTNPQGAFNVAGTGLTPTVGSEKFDWDLRRARGSIFARRDLQATAPLNGPLDYTITIDIDESRVPDGYVLNERIPGDWTITGVTFNGVAAQYNVVNNGDGTQSLRAIFSVHPLMTPPNNQVIDGIFRITGTFGADPALVSGTVSYTLETVPQITAIIGNSRVEAGNTALPVDLYTDEGLARQAGDPKVVDDFDLLYAIDAWAIDAQLAGYGPQWPADITNWDGIILAVIDIWARDAGTQGWAGDGTGFGEAQASTGSSTPGEYVYIPADAAFTAGWTYQSGSGAGLDQPEMFWTQGEWID